MRLSASGVGYDEVGCRGLDLFQQTANAPEVRAPEVAPLRPLAEDG